MVPTAPRPSGAAIQGRAAMTVTAPKVALVTGSARGIGLATAERFLAEGWRVALLDIDAATLAATHTRLARPDDTMAVECDVAEPGQVARAIEGIVARFGRIDCLVNNAGIADFRPILETDFATWSRILAVNLSGPFLCTQAVAPVMLRQGGGSVVNIVSISGLRASTLRVAYGTSKAALMHLTRQQAAELGNMGIRVNAVHGDGEAGPHARHPRRLPPGDPAEPLWHRGRDRRGDLVPRQRPGELCERADPGGGRGVRVDGDRVGGVAGDVGWVFSPPFAALLPCAVG